MYGIRALVNIIAEVVALFPRFGHAEDMESVGHRANRFI
jgi:hypothetical protein